MNDQPAMFTVTIEGLRASLRKIEPGKRGYDKARKNVIYRERDAIALFNQHITEGQPLDGVYSFQSVDNAKTFAFLHLNAFEQQIANNLDRVQRYEAHSSTSG